mmetsp:Transcript_9939/g.24253  ORF Transcript_9939/g.24253 Transcript_9939/m.24253 type:complete len:208 (-) Transcript_9939:11-634(-)
MRQAMKFVFLDVDGVLLPFGEGVKHTAGKFTPHSLDALEGILAHSKATVVLSSTWRCAGGDAAILEQFAEREEGSILYEFGRKGEFEHMTDPEVHTFRQHEIGEWLLAAQGRGLEVGGWVALDDEELVSLEEGEGGGDWNKRFEAAFEGRVVKTASSVGLVAEHVEQAVEALARSWSESELQPRGGSEAGKGSGVPQGKRGGKRVKR